MKGKILILLAVLALLAFPAWGATKISDLPAATTLTGSESLAGVQSGATVKVTPAQIATYAATTYSKGIYVLGASAVQSSITGTTSETVLYTCTVPANAMGANGILRLTFVASNTGSANNKTWRVRWGGISGTVFANVTATTNATMRSQVQIANRGVTNSQVGSYTSLTAAFAASVVAAVTDTKDTTASQTLVVTGALTNTGETMAVEQGLCELIRP